MLIMLLLLLRCHPFYLPPHSLNDMMNDMMGPSLHAQ